MCAIVDADIVYQLVGPKQTEPGRRFPQWLEGGRGELVVGGKNTRELTRNKNFQRWFLEGRRLGRRVRLIRESTIKEAEKRLSGRIRSNDQHVLALALVSGARLLFTDDGRLTSDFVNTDVISGPAGQVYTTRGDLQPVYFRAPAAAKERQSLWQRHSLLDGWLRKTRTYTPTSLHTEEAGRDVGWTRKRS